MHVSSVRIRAIRGPGAVASCASETGRETAKNANAESAEIAEKVKYSALILRVLSALCVSTFFRSPAFREAIPGSIP